jgi:hypothetical protein
LWLSLVWAQCSAAPNFDAIAKLNGSESLGWVKYYNERYLPEWRKAGLPE